jgi:hypothetical protein
VRVISKGILPGRYNQHPGLKPFDCRYKNILEYMPVIGNPAPGAERCVDRVPPAGTLTYFINPARAGENVALVDRTEENAVACVEDLLRPVAVMKIPVNDRNTVCTVKRHRRSNRGIVKEAEPHGTIGFRVMTGWPDKSKAMFPVQCTGNRPDRGSGGMRRHKKRACSDVRIIVKKMRPAMGAHLADKPYMRRVVDPAKVIVRCCIWRVYGHIRRYAGNRSAETAAGLIVALHVVIGKDGTGNGPASSHGLIT